MPVFGDGFTVYVGKEAWAKMAEIAPGFTRALIHEHQERERVAALPFNDYCAYIQNKCAARAEANRAELAAFDQRLAAARHTLSM